MRYRFGAFELDRERMELRKNGEARPIEPQVFDLLSCLIERQPRVVGADELIEVVWHGRIVSDAALSSRVRDARRAIDDDGNRQRWIRTVRSRGFRFAGEVEIVEGKPEKAGAIKETPQPDQDIHFCRSADGTRLAYGLAGNGPPLVKAANWLNHLEFDWQSPVWRHFFADLASNYRLVRYDARGNGLSSWDVADFGFERQVEDLEAVVDKVGLERFPLLGISQGCAKAVAYAARHPQRVSKLVLVGGYARGWRHRDEPDSVTVGEARCALIRAGWGSDNAAIRLMFTTIYMPDAPEESRNWFTDIQKRTTTPNNAADILMAHGDVDIRELLPKVAAPTLVLHARNEIGVPYALGQELAAGIPGAQFATLDTTNHILPVTDPAWPRCSKLIHSFLAE